MSARIVGGVVVFIALFLGGSALRAQAFLTLSARESPRQGVLHPATLVTLAAWFANAVWAIHVGVGFGLGLLFAALLASQMASARTALQWQGVRYWIAIATTASAALLWTALPTA